MATKTRKARKPSNIPANETPEQRFKRMAVPRLQKALRSIRLMGNLTSSRYKFTAAQVETIKKLFAQEINALFGKFEGKKDAGEVKIDL